LLRHFAFFFSALRFLAAKLIFRLEAVDILRFDFVFFRISRVGSTENLDSSVYRIDLLLGISTFPVHGSGT
jgi:hypothetical protein